MKKVLSLILALAMVLTLFTGISISAEDGSDTLVLTAVTPTTSNVKVSLESWSTNDTGYVPSSSTVFDLDAVGTHSGISVDSKIELGVGPNCGVYAITLQPYSYVNPDNNMFMMYVRFPEWISSVNASDRGWCTETMRFMTMGVKQNGTEYHTRIRNSTFYYLDKDGTEWKSGTFSDDEAAVNTVLNGFEGYLMIDLSTVVNYETWKTNGLDANASYQVSYFSMNNSQLGGACGDFAVGGFYCVDSYVAGAISAKIGTSDNAVSLTSYDPNAIKADLLIDDDGGSALNISSNISKGSDLKLGNIDSQTVISSAAAVSPVGNQKAAVISSPISEGYHGANSTYQIIHMNTKFKKSSGSVGIMMYLELPRGVQYNESSFRVYGGTYNDYKAWVGFGSQENAYDYLENGSSEWITGNATDGNKQVTLPNGFKGFVKLYYDEETDVDCWYTEFLFGCYGGDSGDVVIGGVWDITENTDSTNAVVDGVQYAMTDPVIVAYREAPCYPDYNGVVVGNAGGRGSFNGDSMGLSWIYNYTDEPMRNNNSMELIGMEIASATALGENIGVSSPTATLNSYGKVLASLNTFMFYIEVPENADGYDWSVKIDAFAIQQNGKNYYSGGENLVYSYIGIKDIAWTYAMTDSNEHLILPSGFKGYIKIDVSAMSNYNQWCTDSSAYSTLFDPDTDYSLNGIDFKFGTLGGDYGSFKIGGMYNITADSDSIYAKTKDWVYATYITDCLSLYENENQQLIGTVDELITEIGEVKITDMELVDKLLATYNAMSDETKAMLSDEKTAAYNAVVSGFDAYRPSFLGTAVYMPDGSDKAGIRVGAQLDISAASAEGYTATEYGTVMLPEAKFGDNKNFTASDDGAQVLSLTELEDGVTAFKWDAQYETNDWSLYDVDLYFRSYVVYSNGVDTVTVWNAYYTNTVNIFSDELENPELLHYIYTSYETAPYLTTGILKAANKFGASVLAGHAYGNTDGDSDIDSNDMAVMKKRLLGVTELYRDYTADTTGDGNVNILDLIRLKKYMADSTVSMGAEKATNFTLR